MTPSFVGSFKITGKKVFIRLKNQICDSSEELLRSELFYEILKRALTALDRRKSVVLKFFGGREVNDANIRLLIQTFEFVEKMSIDLVGRVVPGSEDLLRDKNALNDFVEYLYNYWRSFDRFIICESEDERYDKRPFRTFNDTIEDLTDLVRRTYREIQENITGTHPRIYRQVAAGAEMAAIACSVRVPYPAELYEKLNAIPVIRQVLFYPPLVLNQLNNTREGKFEKIPENPLGRFDLKRDEWLCYPLKAGNLLILVYFKEKFFEMGLSLCNLFELASDEDLQRKPDAVFVYGAEEKSLEWPGVFPTVFFDDEKNDMLVGAVPESDRFGYFGYLKKMILTLHNIKRIKTGRCRSTVLL